MQCANCGDSDADMYCFPCYSEDAVEITELRARQAELEKREAWLKERCFAIAHGTPTVLESSEKYKRDFMNRIEEAYKEET